MPKTPSTALLALAVVGLVLTSCAAREPADPVARPELHKLHKGEPDPRTSAQPLPVPPPPAL